MNATLCKTADVKLDLYQEEARPLRTTQIAEMYATTPMEAIKPVIVTEPQPSINEEMLHASFEEALSNRLTALYGQWSRLSKDDLQVPTTDTYASAASFSTQSRHSKMQPGRHTEPLSSNKPATPHSRRYTTAIQRGIVMVCIAFMLFLIGFDLMGLLVLHLHTH